MRISDWSSDVCSSDLSGSMPKILSQDEIDAFRARLCTAAEKRFAAQGVAGVSLRQLAEDLGCSAMTPYRYFRDKDAIVAAVRTAALDSFSEAQEKRSEENTSEHKSIMSI